MAGILDGIKGHPKALYMLFFTEMWERFTFYGMRALLILFMVSQFGYADDKANLIYGSYQALVYAMPLFGGMLADRLLGSRRSIVFGGITMAIGSFTMAIPGGEVFFYIGMGLIVCGNGFFKPNISTIVGDLYTENDPRRDSAFSLFYMGINVGAFLGGLLCGYVGQNVSWHAGFGLAGIFMLLGLVVFSRGRGLLEGRGEALPGSQVNTVAFAGIKWEWVVYGLSWLCVPVFVLLLLNYTVMDYVMNPLALAALVYLVVMAFLQTDKAATQKMLAAIVMICFSVLFWGFYEQGGGSLNLYALRNVDLGLFGGQGAAAAVNNSINPFYVILLSPVFATMWVALAMKKLEPSTPLKFALAFLQLALGYYLFVLGAKSANNGMVPFFFFAAGYLLMSTGELCLSPIGLSMVTKLSPARLVGMMMGAWFLASAMGQFVAGKIGALMKVDTEGGQAILSAAESLPIYSGTFEYITYVSLGAGAILLALTPILRRWMHGVH